LPNLTLDCLGKGPAVHLAGLTGKPTVVNLWASWCGPCKQEGGYLSTVSRQLRTTVRFLGIDIEDSDDNALIFDSANVTPPVRYPSVVDPAKKALIALHFPGPPETLLVNSAGRVVHTHPGKYDSAAQLRGEISKYLQVRLAG
jgi:thiol-disulfide isomerase/thioredoxin